MDLPEPSSEPSWNGSELGTELGYEPVRRGSRCRDWILRAGPARLEARLGARLGSRSHSVPIVREYVTAVPISVRLPAFIVNSQKFLRREAFITNGNSDRCINMRRMNHGRKRCPRPVKNGQPLWVISSTT